MVVESVLDTLNSCGHTVTSAVTTFLGINHLVASKIVLAATLLANTLHSLVLTLFGGLVIVVEDLYLFCQETLESAASLCEFVFRLVDHFFGGVVASILSVKDFTLAIFNFVLGILTGIVSAVVVSYEATKDFFLLLGQSVLLLVNLIPRTIYLGITGSFSLAKQTATSSWDTCARLVHTFKSAPLEVLIGFVAGLAILYLSFKLCRRLIREYRITPMSAFRAAINLLTCFYIYFIKGGANMVRLTLRLILTTLAQMHVPRFHHAGDSDQESDDDDDEDLVGHYDSSDNEERERQEQKRRNYEILMRRKEQRRQCTSAEADVEDMLFEQVEREREDKLCAICQDKEKCIMMLPCRHLCVCQECQFLWQQHHNNRGASRKCPICRKAVRQTIKAFL